MSRTSVAISGEQKPLRLHQHPNDQFIGAEVSLFAITVMTSILALIYYINWP